MKEASQHRPRVDPTRRPPTTTEFLHPTPDIQVQLTGEDGNAFAILGRTADALRAAGLPQQEIDDFFAEATSGDYQQLLQTTMGWVDWE